MTTYSKYTPDFKCSSDRNGKGVVNANVGLLSYDEVVYAGGYCGQNNSSYYLNNLAIDWLTMGPTGFSGSRAIATVWYVNTAGTVDNGNVNGAYRLRAVLNLTANTLATGSGTSSDPFVIS